MEHIMAVLTDKQETFLGPIGITGMSAHRASLARIMGIYLDRHRTVQEGFISNHAVQFGKRPLGVGGICFSLLAACLLAFLAFRSLSDVFQLFQADQRMGVSNDDAFGNDMIGVGFQPSLSPAHRHKATGSGTSAFLLQTLSQSCIMVRFGHNFLSRMKGLLSPGGSSNRQVADPDIHTGDTCMAFGCWVSYLDLKGDQQVEVLLGLVIPELGRTDMSALVDERNMFGIPRIGHNHAPIQGQDTYLLVTLEAVVMSKLIGQGGIYVLGRLIESLIEFLGQPSFTCSVVLLDLCPQRLVGGPHLAGDRAGHLCGDVVASAYLIVGPLLQAHLVAHLIVLKGIAADIVQAVAIGQLRVAQGRELGWVRMQFEFGCQCCFHHLDVVSYLMKVVKRQRYPSPVPLPPNKERRIAPQVSRPGLPAAELMNTT